MDLLKNGERQREKWAMANGFVTLFYDKRENKRVYWDRTEGLPGERKK